MDDFRGASAVVTGAASGIGRALCVELCRRGAAVYAADVDEDALTGLAPACRGGSLTTSVLDVRDEHAVAALLHRAAHERGTLDLLFNNAGIVMGGDFAAADAEQWRRIVDINVWGVIHGTRHGYALMREQGHGHIVNTASSAGVMPVVRSAAYVATKHAVVGLSTALRAEAAPNGVRVSVVIPGLVDTGIFDAATNVAGYDYRRTVDRMPLRKVTPARAAEHILSGVSRNKAFIAFPLSNKLIITARRFAPGIIDRLSARQTRGASR